MAIRYLSGINVDSNTLFVDDANNRVGIGTNSPSRQLELVGADAYIQLTRSSTSTQATLGFNTGATNDWLIRTGDGSTSNLQFYSYGTSSYVMTIARSSGNVGIGTTSPLVKLHVDGTGTQYIRVSSSDNATFQQIGAQSGGTFVEYKTLYRFVDTDAGERMRITSAGNVGIGTTGPEQKLHVEGTIQLGNTEHLAWAYDNGSYYNYITNFYNTSDGMTFRAGSWTGGNNVDFSFQTYYGGSGWSTKLAIKGDGNVGIGTTSPSGKLTLYTDGDQTLRFTHPVSGTFPRADRIVFGSPEVDGGSSAIYGVQTAASGAPGYLSFYTTSGGSSSERMRIASNGVVRLNAYGSGGITGTPAYNLAVDASGDIIELPGGVVDGSGTANYVSKWSDANTLTDSQLFDNGTNVGIGTASPQSKLHVARAGNTNGGTILMGVGGSGTDKWSFLAGTHYNQATGSGNGSGSAGVALIGANTTETSNAVYIGGGPYEINPATVIVFNTYTATTHNLGGLERMRITSDGNLSVGTTANPGSRTNIYISESGATPNAILRLQNSGSQYLAKMILTDGNTNDAVIGYQGGVTSATQYLGFGLGTAITQMILTAAGNVGIGTTAPDQKLHVKRTETVNRTSYTDILTIDADANNSPFSGHGGGILFRGTTYSGGGNNIQGNRIWGRIGMFLNDFYDGFNGESMFFAVAPDDRSDTLTTAMTIQYNGNVGIGTTSPSQALHVSGNIRVTGAYYDSSNSAGSSGQVLSSTGSGTDWVSLSEITGVDGTGTANYIAKWSDTDTITNSSITDNGTTVTATATNFVSQSNLGTAYTSFTTSGTTAIFDTITRTDAAIYQMVIVANPNSAGSGSYQDFYYGKVFIGTGYNGSIVAQFINYHQESPMPRGLYGSGGGDLTVTAVMLVSGSEVTEVANGTSYTIRIKIAGYQVAGAGTTVRLQRIM